MKILIVKAAVSLRGQHYHLLRVSISDGEIRLLLFSIHRAVLPFYLCFLFCSSHSSQGDGTVWSWSIFTGLPPVLSLHGDMLLQTQLTLLFAQLSEAYAFILRCLSIWLIGAWFLGARLKALMHICDANVRWQISQIGSMRSLIMNNC